MRNRGCKNKNIGNEQELIYKKYKSTERKKSCLSAERMHELRGPTSDGKFFQSFLFDQFHSFNLYFPSLYR